MQVARQRRSNEKEQINLFGRRVGRRSTLVAAGIAVALAVTGTAVASTSQFATQQVGQVTANGQVISSDQYIAPYGSRTVINNGKIMSSAVSPDGSHLAASVTDGDASLVVMDLKTGQVQQRVGTAATDDLRITSGAVGQEGPTYSPDGSQLWLGQSDGYTKFTVNPDGTLSSPTTISIPADGSKHALVGAAVFSADGSTVYGAVNGQNRVAAIDAATGTIKQSWPVGNAPRGIAMVGNKLYVSNEGGRPAKAGDTTINSYGTQVPANPQTGATTTGTVSVIDLTDPTAAVGSIDVGLHPTAVYAKNGAVFVTNTADNNVSVIDTRKNKVVQTIATQPWPEASVGYEPNAVTLTDDGRLLVTLGRANAVAVYRYKSPQEPASYVGLLPTDYFPAEITTVGKKVIVSNTRGIDARRPTNKAGHGTHDTTSSLTQFTLPDDSVIRSQTGKVFQQNGWTRGSVSLAHGKGDQKQVPVPARLGAPSTIKHVFMIVKENRTYDQVFGDMPQGNGDPSVTQFGENVTPNQHALASQFGLYDNTYDIGTNSAEGHNWLMQADDPEYTESSAGEYTRSYDTEDDALGHQKSGFIWTGAQAAGKSVRDFGEFQSFESKPAGASWQNLYCDTKNMEATGQNTAYPIQTGSAIPSLNKVSVPGFPLFDTSVPDVYKEQIWKQDFEKNGPANLNMFWLSNDHTGGPANAAAQVADNDLAVGRMVDEISHSKYWKDSAIFVVEDDSQAGLDHVDGHRAPIQIISPWAQHAAVDSHYYSQITMIRTIEQILGIHPMNQKDSAASPMRGAFTRHPDFTPFKALPNRTSLTDGLKTPPSCGVDTPAPQDPSAAPVPSAKVPAAKRALAATWEEWKTHQRLTGPGAIPDFANPAQMNHFTWYQTHGWTKPYPGESKIFAPKDVPGAYIPSSESDG
ncbi:MULTISPECIES: bifunctional YncE family protein/alkaline phosphatase family protein [unclassified Streptomyces]|uniref:bifunctional YncE family protein/alkaline phosphatase family protein n=1 Tax=unclassified Streptomyces TaxID=2593676 RepID=UPI00116447EF|nr:MULTISPECIES: phosphoesterase [unclassified Streptomyces]NMI62857.1 phosphoesterase [Streptomyces sp. RLA2-12]QDN61824.1 phosphoesterase [Streptomyces sp. S1D4-20]QDN71877.1 phosphoesterase [Streptomyces sp. S1D4-14]QDO54334.1 phosphoesterase [Streptomyces sp. RLB3-5]QDO64579.1 phosphoesterase [Streptomyces sp. RLB1-8]